MNMLAIKHSDEILYEEPDASPDAGLAPVNILVVDDIPEKLVVYKSILEGLNQNILTAPSGEEALKLILKHEFAVILLDVNMTGMDGFETASMIRSRKKSSRTPIIFLTAFNDEMNIAQGYASGAVDYLPTPVVPEVLRAKVKVFIELSQMRQQAAIQAEERARRAAAEEATRRKDEFLAMLAHELRNPLAPMRNALNVLKNQELPPETVASSCNMMERQLQHMVRLVDDLMDVSRITRGKIDLQMESIAINEALEIALETSRSFIEERNHKLILDIPKQPIYVRADIVRLSQIFANLLNNAGKYTDPGGLITVQVRSASSRAIVSIADNGIGIPANAADQVFDLFMQIDNSLERSHGGLGIGLTLVKNLIELQGGTVSVKSPGAGYGSTFIIEIPLSKQAPHRKDSRRKIAAETKSRKILIVDDNVDSAKTMGWMLELSGHDIYLAHDGPAAITLAREINPDMVLLDIGMPKMNGYEICKILRGYPEFQKTVFVAQTGWGQPEHKRRSQEAGFDFHLVKPVNQENLESILNSMA